MPFCAKTKNGKIIDHLTRNVILLYGSVLLKENQIMTKGLRHFIITGILLLGTGALAADEPEKKSFEAQFSAYDSVEPSGISNFKVTITLSKSLGEGTQIEDLTVTKTVRRGLRKESETLTRHSLLNVQWENQFLQYRGRFLRLTFNHGFVRLQPSQIFETPSFVISLEPLLLFYSEEEEAFPEKRQWNVTDMKASSSEGCDTLLQRVLKVFQGLSKF